MALWLFYTASFLLQFNDYFCQYLPFRTKAFIGWSINRKRVKGFLIWEVCIHTAWCFGVESLPQARKIELQFARLVGWAAAAAAAGDAIWRDFQRREKIIKMWWSAPTFIFSCPTATLAHAPWGRYFFCREPHDYGRPSWLSENKKGTNPTFHFISRP